jgi:hypothetical protein
MILSNMKYNDESVYLDLTIIMSDVYLQICDKNRKHIYGYYLFRFYNDGLYLSNDIGCDHHTDLMDMLDLTDTPFRISTHHKLEIAGIDCV